MQRPLAGQHAAIFIAIAVSQHDHRLRYVATFPHASQFERRPCYRMLQESVQNRAAARQVTDGLEQRDNRDFACHPPARCRHQEPGFAR